MDVLPRRQAEPTRRRLLQAGLAWAVSHATCRTGKALPAGRCPDRTLVLLHLSGGNDGLNALIPYADPLYYELRPRLSRAARNVLPIDSRVGFHRSLSALAPVFERGSLAVIQGVGCPSPDYSHVGSCRIWSTGTEDGTCQRSGWDHVLDRLPSGSRAGVVFVGHAAHAMMGATFEREVRVVDDGGDASSSAKNPVAYRPGQIERTLATIAQLVSSTRPPALVFAAVGGFDTHADQLEAHEVVLRKLGDGMAGFQRTLERRGVAERVALMAWSEFGRRPAENAAGGSDHGTAGPVFLLGKTIRGGLFGEAPSLAETDFGDLIPTVDFRTIHAMLADRWLGCGAALADGRECVSRKGGANHGDTSKPTAFS